MNRIINNVVSRNFMGFHKTTQIVVTYPCTYKSVNNKTSDESYTKFYNLVANSTKAEFYLILRSQKLYTCEGIYGLQHFGLNRIFQS